MMAEAQPHLLIVGSGSVGRRHAKNLTALGAAISCCDPRADRLAAVQQELPRLRAAHPSLERALEGGRYDAAVIASPPHVHVEQAIACLQRGLPLLLEKPVAPDLDGAVRLEAAARQAGVPVLLGYSYRWWPPLAELRRRLLEGRIGTVRHARLVMSAHLADWHPWERYQDFFMANREQGGGALLDESHFIDLMIWCFGMPEAVWGRVERLSSLEITTDDTVDLLAVYPDNLRVSIHLDLYGRPHEKSVTVVGEGGTLQCLFDPHLVRQASAPSGPWEETPFACDRNDMFLEEARELLALVQRRAAAPTCGLADGVRALQCVEAARAASANGRLVRLDEICEKAVES